MAMVLLMRRDIIVYDEGGILVGASRLLNGDVIHRDFYAAYGPGQYAVVAVLFRWFGRSALVARSYDVVVKAAIVALMFHLLARRRLEVMGVVACAVTVALFVAAGAWLYPVFPCLLLALLGAGAWLKALEGCRARMFRAGIAGACAGGATLFRYDVGAFLVLATLLAGSILAFRAGEPGWRCTLCKLALAYGAGTALICGPVFAAGIAAGVGPGFIHDIIRYPATSYAAMRGLPYPQWRDIRIEPLQASVYLVPMAVAGTVWFLWRPPRPDSRRSAALVVFACMAALFFVKGMVRVSALHMLLGNVPALLVTAMLVEPLWRQGGAGRLGALALACVALLPAGSAITREMRFAASHRSETVGGTLSNQIDASGTSSSNCADPTGDGPIRLPEPYRAPAAYLARHVGPAEAIFVGLDHHDKIFANAVALYFALNRLPATHWHQFDPGLTNSGEIQDAIIQDLQSSRVPWIIRDGSFEEVQEPNGSSTSSGIMRLDQFLDSHYRPVARSGRVSIWLSDTAPTPIPDGQDCAALSG